jgi:hypothetical protein
MLYLCFCHACLRFKLVHIAEHVQQRPLGSHISTGRRILCNTGTPGAVKRLGGEFSGGGGLAAPRGGRYASKAVVLWARHSPWTSTAQFVFIENKK